MTPNNPSEIAALPSPEFLAKSRVFLTADDLHQIGKGLGRRGPHNESRSQGWQYTRHSQFHRIMNQAEQATGNRRLPFLHGRAEILRINFYDLRAELEAWEVSRDIEDMAAMLEILYPLTGLESANLE